MSATYLFDNKSDDNDNDKWKPKSSGLKFTKLLTKILNIFCYFGPSNLDITMSLSSFWSAAVSFNLNQFTKVKKQHKQI